MPDRYGPIRPDNLAINCFDPNCLKCPNNYSQCEKCDPASDNRYLSKSDYVCYSVASMPQRKGADDLNNLTLDCTDANCLNCSKNYKVCTQCDFASFFKHLEVDPGVCYSLETMPISKGVNTSDTYVVPCLDTHCLKCSEDYKFCTECDPKSLYKYLHKASGVCYSKQNMPLRFGIDPNTNYTVNCNDTNCLACVDDKEYCVGCDFDNRFLLRQTYCIIAKTPILKLQSTAYSPSNSTAVIRFDKPIHNHIEMQFIYIDIRNEIGAVKRVRSLEKKEYEVWSEDGFLKIRLYLREMIDNSTLIVRNSVIQPSNKTLAPTYVVYSSDEDSYLDDYPFEVPDIFGVIDNPLLRTSGLTEVLASTAIFSIVCIILMSSNPASAMLLDRLLTNVFYQRNLNGPMVVYPERSLRQLSDIEQFPFKTPDPIGK